jgi:hypothetical protein
MLKQAILGNLSRDRSLNDGFDDDFNCETVVECSDGKVFDEDDFSG